MFKNRKELAIALMEGRRFKTESDYILYYDGTAFDSPFRYKSAAGKQSDAMVESWRLFDSVEEIDEWYRDIPTQGVLCWVWNNCHEYDRLIRLVVGIKTKGDKTVFRSNPSVYWDFAKPLTKKEVLNSCYEGSI